MVSLVEKHFLRIQAIVRKSTFFVRVQSGGTFIIRQSLLSTVYRCFNSPKNEFFVETWIAGYVFKFFFYSPQIKRKIWITQNRNLTLNTNFSVTRNQEKGTDTRYVLFSSRVLISVKPWWIKAYQNMDFHSLQNFLDVRVWNTFWKCQFSLFRTVYGSHLNTTVQYWILS